MKIEYDPKHDVLNIEFLPEESVKESKEFDGVIIDYTKEGKIASIEILDAGPQTELLMCWSPMETESRGCAKAIKDLRFPGITRRQ